MIHVVSFSGGRTSAYLVHLMEKKRRNEGWDVRYLFMDTGAEHPATYKFIREIVEHWGIDLTCIRAKIQPKLGVGAEPQVLSPADCKHDLIPWEEMVKKHSNPYLGGAFCTRIMKSDLFVKYANNTFGRGNYTMWLGMRSDESARLKPRRGVHYLAELSEFDKDDVLAWWRRQEFDLEIEEHLGNCVFCVKKNPKKLALAMRDEPELLQQFLAVIESDEVRIKEGKDRDRTLRMYRGNTKLQEIQEMFAEIDRDDLYHSLRMSKRYETGSCTESCEAINPEQLSLFDFEPPE